MPSDTPAQQFGRVVCRVVCIHIDFSNATVIHLAIYEANGIDDNIRVVEGSAMLFCMNKYRRTNKEKMPGVCRAFIIIYVTFYLDSSFTSAQIRAYMAGLLIASHSRIVTVSPSSPFQSV